MNSFSSNLMIQGGVMMWPLLLLSLVALVIFIERTLYLHRGNVGAGEFNSGIKNLLRKRRLLEALTVCEETSGPVARIIKTALVHSEEPEGKIKCAVYNSALVEIPILERRIGTLGMIAKVAPLIGLLGTLLGLMQAYFSMESLGVYVNGTELSGYVGQALITSITGLAVAIMAYGGHHFLVGRVKGVVNNMEWISNDIIEFLLYDLPEEEGSSNQNLDPASSELKS